MADGEVKIELELDDSKAKSQGTKSGQQISKGIESGLKGADTAAQNTSKNIDKAFKNSGKNAKTSFQEVGNSAKSSFNDVGDAARSASSDAASAFEEIPADASGAFADVGSEAQNGFDGVADAAHNASSDAADAFDEIPEAAEDAAQETNNAFSVKMVAIGNIIADAAEKAVSALIDVAKAAVETGMAFDKSMSQVAATMGVTTDSIGELRDFAKEMGASTAFSATQASEALNYMALAGYDASTSMRVLPTVLNLAAAGNMELAAASDMVTDAQSALGLSLEETEAMVDQMAKTSSKTNTSVSQLGDAFLTVGGTAKNLAGGTAELAQMLGILADNGIKGAEGGTALRNVILSLSAPTDVAAKKMDELGLAVFDAEGNMRPMPDIMRDLNKSMEPLTQQEKTDALNTIFNKVDLKSVNALLGTSAERFDEVAFAIDNATGSAEKMANTQLDNLAGDVTLLESAFEGLQIQISDAVTPVLRDMVQTVTNAVIPAFSTLVSNADKLVPIIANIALGFAAWKVAVPIIKSYQAALAATGRSVQSLTVAEKAHTIAVQAGTKAMQLFSKAGAMLKTALPVLAITLALEAITVLSGAIKDAQEKQEQYTKATQGLKDAFKQIDDAAVNTAKSLNDISTDKPRRAMADLKSSIDETIASQAQLADKITEDWTDINTNAALIETYIDTINRLTNAYDENGNKRQLNAEEQAALIAAVSGYNEITGESVNVIDAVNGVLDQSTAKLNQNAEAWINNAKKQAAQEELVSLAKERLKLQKDLGEAETAYQKAIEYRNKAIANGIPLTAEENQMIADSEANLNKCRDALDANTESQQWLTDQIAEVDSALRSSAEALANYIKSNDEWSAALEGAGVNIDEFASKLSELGFSTDELATMSGEKLKALANSYKLSTEEIIAVCEQMGIEVPEKLRQVGVDSVDALADGISEEQQTAIDAALEVAGVTHDEFAKLVDEAGITGGDATVAYAEGIASEKQQSQSAAQLNAKVALEGYKTEDTFAAGQGEGGAYAEGVASAEGESRASGETDANAAADGMQSQNKNARDWGFDLGSLFAKGIEAAESVVRGAANFIGGIVQSILGHSVPKEGILRNGGQGEKPWGRHLVENIAEGMRSAQSDVKDAADESAQIIEDAFAEVSPWDNIFNVDNGIIKGVSLDAAMANPFGTLADTLKGNVALMATAANNYSNTYNDDHTVININSPVKNAAQFERDLRIQRTYGLAGARR